MTGGRGYRRQEGTEEQREAGCPNPRTSHHLGPTPLPVPTIPAPTPLLLRAGLSLPSDCVLCEGTNPGCLSLLCPRCFTINTKGQTT